MEKVRGQILVCGKSGSNLSAEQPLYTSYYNIILLFGAEVRHIETERIETLA